MSLFFVWKVPILVLFLLILLRSAADDWTFDPAPPAGSIFSPGDLQPSGNPSSGNPIIAATASGVTTGGTGNNGIDPWGQSSDLSFNNGESPEALLTSASAECPNSNNIPSNKRVRIRRGGSCGGNKKSAPPTTDSNSPTNSNGRSSNGVKDGSPDDDHNGKSLSSPSWNPEELPTFEIPAQPPPIVGDRRICDHDFINVPVCAVSSDARSIHAIFPDIAIIYLPKCMLYNPYYGCVLLEDLWCCGSVYIKVPDPSLRHDMQGIYTYSGYYCVLQKDLWYLPGK